MDVSARLQHYLALQPQTAAAYFVAANATLIGDVRLGAGSSVFYGAVLRADINTIVIGPGSNVQDNVVIHLSDHQGVQVDEECTIGHAAILHACHIEAGSLIGMGATVLDGAVIATECLVAARALVTHNFTCPPGSLILGSPAKVVRPLTAEERLGQRKLAHKYQLVAQAHAALRR